MNGRLEVDVDRVDADVRNGDNGQQGHTQVDITAILDKLEMHIDGAGLSNDITIGVRLLFALSVQDGSFLKTYDLGVLTYVSCYADNFAAGIVFLEPRYNY